MALKIRQKKEPEQPQHKAYMSGAQRTWMDDEREQSGADMRKTFWRIIILAVVILVIIIASVVAASMATAPTEQTITASDTFAVSQREQEQMVESSKKFAEGMIVYAYCSDPDKALAGKNQALSQMATNTDRYTEIENMDGNTPLIAFENLYPVVKEPSMQAGTQSYAGNYVYEVEAGAADVSVVSDANPNGTFADAGYKFELRFDMTQDESTGENIWVISDAKITRR